MEADIVGRRLTAPVGGSNRNALKGIARLFLRLGLTAFGGPSAHVALMETEVVTRRAWLTRAEFLDQLALVQVLPGPNSTELAIHIGHTKAGWRGAMVAGLAFVLPSVVMVWVLMAMTQTPALASAVRGVLWWLAPVVVVIIAEALWKFGRQAFARPGAAVVMPVTAVAAMVLPSDLAVLLTGAVLSMAIGSRGSGRSQRAVAVVMVATTLLVAGAVSAQAVHVAQGSPEPLSVLLYFLRAGVSVFGSGYVLLAYLQRDLVDGMGWMTMGTLLQASALAQITPGPLFSTATAAGYVIGGSPGAAAATVGIFAPAFASVAAGAPLRRLLQRASLARHALHGVVIASVSLLGRSLVGFVLPLAPWQWIVLGVAGLLLLLVRVQATLLLVTAVAIGAAGTVFDLVP